MFTKTAFLLLGFLALVSSQSTSVNQCVRSDGSLPLNTYIENCPTPPCQLPQLQDVVINIIFKAPYTMRRMRTLATAYLIGAIGINYDLGEHASTCDYLTNTYCPVLQDEVVAYTLRMYIESWFPVGTSVTVEFRVVDDDDVPVVCIRVPIAIIAALPSGRLEATNGTVLLDTEH